MVHASSSERKSGLYIHYPFCRNKCPYCGFSSFTRDDWKSIYLECLLAEIEKTAVFFGKNFPIADTIYFGGGTPSLMPLYSIEEILNRLRQYDYFPTPFGKMEITMETNPDDLDLSFLKTAKSIGINRLSIGAQRFNDSLLQILGRKHKAEDVLKGFNIVRDAGFENVSVDFMLGVPGENRTSMARELDILTNLKPEHISVYMLEIKEHTPFADKDNSFFPDEDLTADLYLEAAGILTAAGYDHYEISNFALPGYKSIHNLKYWSGGQWLGLGLSSASCSGKARWVNPSDLSEYINRVVAEDFTIPPVNSETDKLKLAEEELFMGMRKTSGIDLTEFIKRNGYNPLEKIDEEINQFVEDGLLIKDEILCHFIS
jgi:oxygen-independent coproporphyrinogen-3 oxidase